TSVLLSSWTLGLHSKERRRIGVHSICTFEIEKRIDGLASIYGETSLLVVLNHRYAISDDFDNSFLPLELDGTLDGPENCPSIGYKRQGKYFFALLK
ncbi:hypothetical protein CDAR_227701, partial [Caerostris darwini]